jgi:hypothetical protein
MLRTEGTDAPGDALTLMKCTAVRLLGQCCLFCANLHDAGSPRRLNHHIKEQQGRLGCCTHNLLPT